MERLTYRDVENKYALSCGYENCDVLEDNCILCQNECKAVDVAIKRLAEYEKTNLEPSQLKEISPMYQSKCEEVAKLQKSIEKLKETNLDAVEMCKIHIGLEKLKEYQQKLADGRMVELPCKTGDVIFLVDYEEKVIDESEVLSIDIGTGNSINTTSDYLERMDSSAFGKYAFKSKEEAEQALKESSESNV